MHIPVGRGNCLYKGCEVGQTEPGMFEAQKESSVCR